MGNTRSNHSTAVTANPDSVVQLSKRIFGFTLPELVSYGAMLITFGGSFFVFMNELPKQDKLRDDIVNLKLSNAVLTTEVNYLKTEVKEFRVKTEFSK